MALEASARDTQLAFKTQQETTQCRRPEAQRDFGQRRPRTRHDAWGRPCGHGVACSLCTVSTLRRVDARHARMRMPCGPRLMFGEGKGPPVPRHLRNLEEEVLSHSITTYDTYNQHSYAYYTNNYDSQGRYISQQVVYDDGSSHLFYA